MIIPAPMTNHSRVKHGHASLNPKFAPARLYKYTHRKVDGICTCDAIIKYSCFRLLFFFFRFQKPHNWHTCENQIWDAFHDFNPSVPSAAYMRRWTGSALFQVMACRLFDAKPLPEPMLTYRQLDLQEQTSGTFESQYQTFHSWKCICEIVTTLSAVRWVNSLRPSDAYMHE